MIEPPIGKSLIDSKQTQFLGSCFPPGRPPPPPQPPDPGAGRGRLVSWALSRDARTREGKINIRRTRGAHTHGRARTREGKINEHQATRAGAVRAVGHGYRAAGVLACVEGLTQGEVGEFAFEQIDLLEVVVADDAGGCGVQASSVDRRPCNTSAHRRYGRHDQFLPG
jgi:hypothetical protein